MKNAVNRLFFGRDKFSGLIALVIVSLIALGCTCGKELGSLSENTSRNDSTSSDSKDTSKKSSTKADASTGEVPTDAQLQQLVKATLLEFDSAVQKKDFEDFHSNISELWQKQTTPGELESIFKPFIDGKISISKIGSMEAEFTSEPEVATDMGIKMLKVTGKYPTKPTVTKFDLSYIPEDTEWKLAKIEVDTTSKF